MGSTVDGMISGLNTSDMISQLMQLEAAPQTALKTKVSVQSKAVSAYQSVNTRFAGMLSAARAVSASDTWGAMKATASSDAAAVSAKPGSLAGSLSFTVDRLASAHTVTFKDDSVAALTDPVMTGGTLTVKLAAGGTESVTITDTSLGGVVAAINKTEGAAYTAAAVKLSSGAYTLQLTAKTTGAASVFAAPAEIDQLGTAAAITQGLDAKLTVGTAATYEVTSATNTFSDVLPGVTITVAKTSATPVTVSLARDSDGIAAKMQALVDNVNTALSDITSQTRVKSGDVPAGPLAGDSALRGLAQEILGAVSGGAGELGSFNQVGVTVTRDGRLAFDKQKFLTALAADPAKTEKFFGSYADRGGHADAVAGKFQPGWDAAHGLGRKLEAIGAIASEGVIRPGDPAGKAKEGTLTGLIKRRNDQIRGLNDQVAAWDQRLELRRTALERQWSGLEVALGKLQSQSNWLAGQLSGLAGSA
jgi:flagellar hook-associated protein 2